MNILAFIIPMIPTMVYKGIGLFRKEKDRKQDQKRREIVEKSIEFQPDERSVVSDFEILQCRDLQHNNARKWGTRKVSSLKYLVIHHTATDNTRSDWSGIADYATTPSKDNHISTKGAPYIPYHFGVDLHGVFQFNDLTEVTWAARGYNIVSIHIAVLGNFETKNVNKGNNELSPVLHSQLRLLVKSLLEEFPTLQVKSHRQLGKIACPGDELQKFVDLKEWEV